MPYKDGLERWYFTNAFSDILHTSTHSLTAHYFTRRSNAAKPTGYKCVTAYVHNLVFYVSCQTLYKRRIFFMKNTFFGRNETYILRYMPFLCDEPFT